MATELRRVLPHGIIHVRGAEYFGDTQLSRHAGQTVLLDIPDGDLPSELTVKLVEGDRLIPLGTVMRDRGYLRRICPWIPAKEVLAQAQS